MTPRARPRHDSSAFAGYIFAPWKEEVEDLSYINGKGGLVSCLDPERVSGSRRQGSILSHDCSLPAGRLVFCVPPSPTFISRRPLTRTELRVKCRPPLPALRNFQSPVLRPCRGEERKLLRPFLRACVLFLSSVSQRRRGLARFVASASAPHQTWNSRPDSNTRIVKVRPRAPSVNPNSTRLLKPGRPLASEETLS